MFLLKLSEAKEKTALYNSLHSTMFLLKLYAAETTEGTNTTLHSTMFLLKLILSQAIQITLATLHSTMFLLKHETIAARVADKMIFTFHNVYIKTRICL